MSTAFTKLCHLKEFDDYITLHNPSMLVTFVVTLYLMHCGYCREVVNINFHSSIQFMVLVEKV